MKKEYKIGIMVGVIIIGVVYWFWPRNRFADFSCTGFVEWCETEHFGKVPLCYENNGINWPSAFYGDNISMGQVGGYFWNGRTKEQDAEKIANNINSYLATEVEANKKMLVEIKKCLKK